MPAGGHHCRLSAHRLLSGFAASHLVDHLLSRHQHEPARRVQRDDPRYAGLHKAINGHCAHQYLSIMACCRDQVQVRPTIYCQHSRRRNTRTGAHTRLAGATLMKQGQQVYLAAVLGDAQTGALGTFIYPFADVARGKLAVAKDGRFALARHIPRQSTSPTAVGGGYATFDESCAGGVVVSEYSGLRNRYQLFKTAETP